MDSAKYLGVTIKDLSWNSHIENITVSANRPLGFVKRNIKTRNQEIRTIAYNTLVRPQVEYASAVWSPYTKENINKIEMLQKRAARSVCNDYSPYSSVTDMLCNLGWRSLEPRRSRCFIKSCMGWSLYQFLHILNVSWYRHATILLLTGRSILLAVITTTHSSQ